MKYPYIVVLVLFGVLSFGYGDVLIPTEAGQGCSVQECGEPSPSPQTCLDSETYVEGSGCLTLGVNCPDTDEPCSKPFVLSDEYCRESNGEGWYANFEKMACSKDGDTDYSSCDSNSPNYNPETCFTPKQPNAIQRILEGGLSNALGAGIVALFGVLAALLNPRIRNYLSRLLKRGNVEEVIQETTPQPEQKDLDYQNS